MISRLILSIFTFMSNGTLLLFSLRRWLFLLTAWRLGRFASEDWRVETSPPLPCFPAPLLLLVPFRDEAANLRQLLPMLTQLDYPMAWLTVVLVDDGSRDESGRFCQQFITHHQHPHWHLLTLPQNLGKAAALNQALSHFPQGEFVAVFDADERPSPHTLTHLLTAITEKDELGIRNDEPGSALPPLIGAVNGRRAIHNPLATPIASYAALENLVHQLITNRAKDQLNLAPALLGSNCLYRRQALTAVHNFTANTLLEDSDLTVRLTQAGWRTRFIPTAISHHAAPQTLRGYWQQHSRWNAGFQQITPVHGTFRRALHHSPPAVLTHPHLPCPLRLELLLFSLGYLDRLALFIALVSWWQRPSRLTTLNISLTLLTPLLQISYALKITKAPARLWQRLAYLPLFYTLDIAATLTSTLQKVTRQPVRWEKRQGLAD